MRWTTRRARTGNTVLSSAACIPALRVVYAAGQLDDTGICDDHDRAVVKGKKILPPYGDKY
jgi:hypothetical protein